MTDIRDRWATAVLKSELGNELKVTCWGIREYANGKGRATVGIEALARDIGVHRRTIIRRLNKIVAAHYLERLPGEGIQGPGGKTTLTLLRIPEKSGDTQGATTSTRSSSDSHDDTTLNDKACHESRQGVTPGGSSGDTLGVTRTILNHIEPGPAAALAPDGARLAPKDEDPIRERNRHIMARLRAGEQRFRLIAGFGVTEQELDALEAAMRETQSA